jgi:beta-N-acetylhexosaminidase
MTFPLAIPMNKKSMTRHRNFTIGACLTQLLLGSCAPIAPGAPNSPPHPDRAALLGKAHPGQETALTTAEKAWVEHTLASLSLREKVGQLIMPWLGGEYAAVGSPEFEQARRWVEDDEVGGIVLSIGEPLSYAAKLNELQLLAKTPLLVASDMENGPGMRLSGIYALPSLLPQGGGTAFPPVMGLGATRSEDLAYQLGQVLGREARAIGVHLVFGPVLDVNANPLNPIINTRSFGENPALVSALASAYIRGARSTGIMTTGKHFPGHGDTDVDSHLDLPTIRAGRSHLDSIDFPPFRAAINAGIDAIMTAHIAEVGVEGAGAPPATLSHLFMSDVLRNEMGFHGLLFTDAMTMGGIAKRYGASEPLILALEAGTDFLLMPRDVKSAIDTIVAAVHRGRLSEERIDGSVRRVLAAKARAGLTRGRLVDIGAVDRVVNVPANQRVADTVAARSITLGLDTQNLVPLPADTSLRVLSVAYSESSNLTASTTFDATLRAALPRLRTTKVDPRTPATEYTALAARAASSDIIIVSVYVSPVAARGSVAADTSFAAVIDSLATSGKRVVVVSLGSPYVVSAFPAVSTFLFAWGGAPVSQSAAALALLGARSISGKLPVSIPPRFQYGDGLTRAAVRSEILEKTPNPSQ